MNTNFTGTAFRILLKKRKRSVSGVFILVLSSLLIACAPHVTFEEACKTHGNERVTVEGHLNITDCYAIPENSPALPLSEVDILMCTGVISSDKAEEANRPRMGFLLYYFAAGVKPLVLTRGSPRYPIENLEKQVCGQNSDCSLEGQEVFRITGDCDPDLPEFFTVDHWKEIKYIRQE